MTETPQNRAGTQQRGVAHIGVFKDWKKCKSQSITGRNNDSKRDQKEIARLGPGDCYLQMDVQEVGVTEFGRALSTLEDLDGNIDRGWAHLDVAFDTLDSQSFATRGGYGRVSVRASREELGADDNYTRLDGQFYKALSFGKNTFVPRVRAGLKVGSSDIPIYDRSPLGGFLELSDLARGDLYD